ERGAIQLRKEWFDLEGVIGAALARLGDALGDRPVRTSGLSSDLPLVAFDGVLIELALTNLIENAIRHTPPHSSIDISVSSLNEAILVEVVDRGPGIPAPESERIFDIFHKVPGRPSHEGVGLGLAIAQRIVLAHGGKIWVENRPGAGAAFCFTLPAAGVH